MHDSMHDAHTPIDTLTAELSAARRLVSSRRIIGAGHWQLIGPDGRVKAAGVFTNLISQTGDRMYNQRGAGVGSAAAAPTGMRLGTGSTAPAKTGSGAAIVTYVSGSHKAFDATYPQEAAQGNGSRATYRCTWPAGTATANGIAEAVVTNESPLTDVAGTAANTVSRALLSPTINKAAGDSLVLTWQHDLLGA
jgi:hypothetical protein